MQIRQATIEDAPAISQLIVPLAETHIAHEFTPEGAANLLKYMQPEAIQQCFEDGYDYHVAEEHGVIVGAVGTRDNSHLYHLFVADAWSGRGFARQLWLTALNACRERADIECFTVYSSAYAIGMYRGFGFVQTGPADVRNGVSSFPMKLTVIQ